MKRLLFILLTILLTTACTRAASTPEPTGLPLNFPTPAPGSVPLCQPTDLKTSSNSNADAGVVNLGVTLTNQSKNPCALSNPAQIALLNASNESLQVTSEQSTAIQTPPAPDIVQLAPGGITIVTLTWRNFCENLASKDLTLRLQLSEKQNLDISMQAPLKPVCENRNQVSIITITPYSDPP